MDLATSAISKDSPQNGLRPLWTYKDDIQTYLHVNNLSLLTFLFLLFRNSSSREKGISPYLPIYKKGLPFGHVFPEDIFELLGMCVCRGVPDHNPPSEVPARSRFGRNGPLDAACPIRIRTGARSRFFL